MTTVGLYTVFLLLLISAAGARTPRSKQLLLLAGSYLFYGIWGLEFLAILIGSSLVNFGIGIWLQRRPTRSRLWVGIALNVGLLGFFKYVPSTGSVGNLAMPAGISFWTFQALSYLFDLYREDELDPTLAEFCLYMAFWPTVLLGPICRLSKLLPQFRETRPFSSDDLAHGMRRIGTGLVMKVVLAQLLASGVNAGFDGAENPLRWSGWDVWSLAIGFGFQLFFDFAGYSHIMIGAARLFGFELEENFDSPYLSTTPAVFWTRWHMSLSSWIRDYVFIPLATLRRESWWRYFAVWFSMVLFGLWHGASLTFLLWGAYQGALLVLHRTGQQIQHKFGIEMNGPIAGDLSAIATFLSISLGWIAFRANNLNQAMAMFRAASSPYRYAAMNLPLDYYLTVFILAGSYFAYESFVGSSYFLRAKKHLPLTTGYRVAKITETVWENRWFWAAPALTLLALLAVLVVFQDVGVKVSPFVYSRF